MWKLDDKYKECCHNDACESFDTCIDCWNEWEENHPPMTNADRIRAMTDEELAAWLSICGCPDAFSMVGDCESGKCEECWIAYLQQPYISEDIKSSEYIEKDIEGDA